MKLFRLFLSLVISLALQAPAWAVDRHSVVASVPTGSGGVAAVRVSPDGSFILVSREFDGKLSKVNAATQAVEWSISMGVGIPGYPTGVSIANDGSFALVAMMFAGELKRVALSGPNAGTITDTITVGTFPQFVEISPNGTTAYVTSQSSGQIHVIDLSSMSVSAVYAAGPQPLGITISPDGQHLYVATATFGVKKLNAADGQVVGSVALGGVPVVPALSPDGQTLLVARNNVGIVAEIDASTMTLRRSYSFGGIATNVAVAPNGVTAYALGVASVQVLNLSTGAVDASIPVSDPYGLDFSPDGNYAYVGSGYGNVNGQLKFIYSGSGVPAPAPAVRSTPSWHILGDSKAGVPTLTVTNETVTCGAGSYVMSSGQVADVQSAVYTLVIDGMRVSTVSSDDFTMVPRWIVDPSSGRYQGVGTTAAASWSRAGLPRGSYRCEVLAYQWHSTMLWSSETVRV